MKLEPKAKLLLIPLITIPILMIGVVSFYNSLETTEERLNSRVTTQLNQISRQTINAAQVAKANLRLLSEHPLVQKYATTKDKTLRHDVLLPKLLSLFKHLNQSIPNYLEVKFISPNGYEEAYWSSSKTDNIKKSIADEWYFAEMRKSSLTENALTIFDENSNNYALLVTRNILIPDETSGDKSGPLGYLAILLDLSSLQTAINTSVINGSGYFSVIDYSGKILFLPKNVPMSSAENNVRLLGEKISMEYSNEQTKIISNGDVVFSYWKSVVAGMSLIGFVPDNALLYDSFNLNKTVFVMTVLVALYIIITILILFHYLVVRPIESLNYAAQEIKNGNLDVDISINRDDEIGDLLKSFHEISKDLRQTHEEINYIENHDSLTGLPNANMFSDYLQSIIAIANTKRNKLSLLFIKLDGLKKINNNYGKDGGDAVLKEMALRLNNSLRKTKHGAIDLHDKSYDIVSRISDGDFIILLDNVDGPWDATVVADRVLTLLQKPIQINDEQLSISCSIGATVYPDDALTVQELIKNADIAMYRAKDRGLNNYEFYASTTNTLMQSHLRIHSRLRSAIDDNQFFMEYQPKLDSVNGLMVGMEALIRWQDPEDGLISPDTFLPIAENSGLISEITKWVIHDVCSQAMDWFNAGRLTIPIAINISAIEFKRFDLLTTITDCLKEAGLPPELLELELTETSLLSDIDHAVDMFTSLRKLGVSVTLNNFGTGYSSLNDLNRLPINTLKIDRSHVAEIKSQDDNSAIIDAIIALGHALGLTVVADGVETEVQREYLKSKSCDVLQGFFFNKSLSAEDITLKLDELIAGC